MITRDSSENPWKPIYQSCLLLLLLPLGSLLAGCQSGTVAESEAEGQGPRLAVLVIFDQLRGDYLSRWQDLFGPGGFRRLQTEGAWYSNCHYPYADTTTGPGHASVLTGCFPADHGIIANGWYDPAPGAMGPSAQPSPPHYWPPTA